MDTIQTQCPMCHCVFTVPAKYLKRKAKCQKCGQNFVIKTPDMDDTILGWLNDKQQPVGKDSKKAIAEALGGSSIATVSPKTKKADHKSKTSAPQPASHKRASRSHATHYAHKAIGPNDSVSGALTEHSRPKAADCLRLSHTDELGAFVLFPSTLLYDKDFRMSMPRCCLSCGSTEHLKLHLMNWQSIHNDLKQVKKDAEPIKSSIKADEFMKLSDAELLAKLPRLHGKPEPFDLPMPYYICDRCTPVGAIMTHVRSTSADRQICEVGINSLHRAAQFLAANLGRDHKAFKHIEHEISTGKANEWTSLPLAVRNRLEKWFTPEKNENFKAYIMDQDFAKAEGGLGGVIITDHRLIYHKYAAHREFSYDSVIQLEDVNDANRFMLRIYNDSDKPAQLKCDKIAVDRIKENLKALGKKYHHSF